MRILSIIVWSIVAATLGVFAYQGLLKAFNGEARWDCPAMYLAIGFAVGIALTEGICAYQFRKSRNLLYLFGTIVASFGSMGAHYANFSDLLKRESRAPIIVAEAKIAAEEAVLGSLKEEAAQAKLEWEKARQEAREELAGGTSGKGGAGKSYEALVKAASEMQNIWRDAEQAYREEEARARDLRTERATAESAVHFMVSMPWWGILVASAVAQFLSFVLAWLVAEPKEVEMTAEEEEKLLKSLVEKAAERQRNLKIAARDQPKRKNRRKAS